MTSSFAFISDTNFISFLCEDSPTLLTHDSYGNLKYAEDVEEIIQRFIERYQNICNFKKPRPKRKQEEVFYL